MDAANEAANVAEPKCSAQGSPEWQHFESLRLEAAKAVDEFISALLADADCTADIARDDPAVSADAE